MVEKLKLDFKTFFSNSPKAKFMLGLVVATSLIFTIYGMKKTIIISIDGNEQTIMTFKGTVEGALHDNGIVLGPKDKIAPSLDSKISKNSKIDIKRAVEIEVAVDGENRRIQTAAGSVDELLSDEGINISQEDKIVPSLTTPITEGLKVEITRVNTQIVKETKNIDFATEMKSDDNLDKSVMKTIQEGVPGEKEITYKVVYENGKEVSRSIVNEVVLREPKSKVVVKGTLNTIALSRGETISYRKKVSVVATAYALHNRTATGAIPKRNPSGISTIAVDPSVIPLGSKVYVSGYGYAIAQDTGGAIKNRRIDVYMNSENEAFSWGVKNVDVYIISYPGK